MRRLNEGKFPSQKAPADRSIWKAIVGKDITARPLSDLSFLFLNIPTPPLHRPPWGRRRQQGLLHAAGFPKSASSPSSAASRRRKALFHLASLKAHDDGTQHSYERPTARG